MDAARVQESTLRSEGVLRRIRWAGVILGAATTLLLVWLCRFIEQMIWRIHYDLSGDNPAGVIAGAGGPSIDDYLYPFIFISCWLAAHLMGGLVAGRMAASSPGLNGAARPSSALWWGLRGSCGSSSRSSWAPP